MLTKYTVQDAKSQVKTSRPYIYDVKFLALLGAPYMCDISRLRVKDLKNNNAPAVGMEAQAKWMVVRLCEQRDYTC
jgi:hypothetical protein